MKFPQQLNTVVPMSSVCIVVITWPNVLNVAIQTILSAGPLVLVSETVDAQRLTWSHNYTNTCRRYYTID